MGTIKNLCRKLSCYDELRRILEEEDILVKEWVEQWKKPTGISRQFSYHNRKFGIDIREPKAFTLENNFLRKIWDQLVVLDRETRKLEELKQLMAIGEENMPNKARKIIKQLKKSLEIKPLLLGKKEEAYIKTTVTEGGLPTTRYKFDKGRYQQIVDEITNNEAEFWNYLNQEKNKIKSAINKEILIVGKIKKKANDYTILIKSDDKNWWKRLAGYLSAPEFQRYIHLQWTKNAKLEKDYNQEDMDYMFAELKGKMGDYFAHIVVKCNKIRDFYSRALGLLDDIEARLEATEP